MTARATRLIGLILAAVGLLVLVALALGLPRPPAQGSPAPRAAPAPSTAPVPAGWTPLREPGVGGAVVALTISPYDPQRVLAGGDMLGIALSTDGGDSWRHTAGLESAEVASFTWHPVRPDEVWAATMSGPYVSLDAGATWQARRAGLPPRAADHYTAPVQEVLFHPADAGRLLAFGGSRRDWASPGTPAWGAVWASSDGGASWSRAGTVGGALPVQSALWLADGSLLVAAREAGLWRSTDGGASWAPAPGPQGVVDGRELVRSAADPRTLLLATGSQGQPAVGGVFRSTDAGATWAPAVRGLPQVRSADPLQRSQYNGLTAVSDGRLLVSENSFQAAGVFASSDGGASWRPVLSGRNRPRAPYGSGLGMNAIAVSAEGRRVVAGSDESLYVSTDGGRRWGLAGTREVSPGRWSGGGWSGLVATRVRFDPARPGRIALTAMDGGNVILSEDGGSGWRRPLCAYDCYTGAYDVAYAGPRAYALLGQSGGFRGLAVSGDGGQTWQVRSGAAAGLPELGTSNGDPQGGIAAVDPRTVLATVGGALYRSADGGQRWQQVLSGGVQDVRAAGTDPRRVYASSPTDVWRSDDGGSTFRALPRPWTSPAVSTRLTVDPTDPDVVHLARWRAPDGGLLRFDGTRWARLSADPLAYDVAVDPADPQRLVLARNDHPYHDVARGGVRLSTDGGRTFRDLGAELPMQRASAVAFDPHTPGRVVVGLYGGGFWSRQLPAGQAATRVAPISVSSASSRFAR